MEGRTPLKTRGPADTLRVLRRSVSSRVLLPPFPRRRKGSRPDAALRGFGLVLLRLVLLDEACGQSPPLPHQPCIHIGAIRQFAHREQAMISVVGSAVARQVISANKASQ